MKFVPRNIPLFDDAGQYLPDAPEVLLSLMLLPDDIKGVASAMSALRGERGTGEPSKLLQDLVNRMLSRLPMLQLCGDVAWQMVINVVEGGEPSLRKAAFVVSELNATQKTREGKPLPVSPIPLRQNVRKFSSVLHLWCGFNRLPDRLQDDFLAGKHHAMIELFTRAGVAEAGMATCRVFDEWSPWVVPDEVHLALLHGRATVDTQGIPSDVIDKMSEYRRAK